MTTNSGGTIVTTHYGWCGETLCQARTATYAPLRRYLVEGEANLSDGALLTYGVDHLGSVRDVIAAPGGQRTNHFDYDPYGTPTTSLGSALTRTDFRHAGLFYHPQSGLYFATRRANDPAVGRWLSRDPIGEAGGLNLYGYVGGNPVTLIDPAGLCPRGLTPTSPCYIFAFGR